MNRSTLIGIDKLLSVWRIIVCIIICQLIGPIISVAINLHHDSFLNMWIGGAVASPIGYFIGLLWHLSKTKTTEERAIPTTIFLGILAIFLGYEAIFNTIPETINYMASIDRLRSIKEEKINKISLYDRDRKKHIRDLTEPKIISEFSLACKDIKGYSPNHPNYISSWSIIIYGKEKMIFECHFQSGRTNELIGYFVTLDGSSFKSYGSFSSINLRAWFEKYFLSINR